MSTESIPNDCDKHEMEAEMQGDDNEYESDATTTHDENIRETSPPIKQARKYAKRS